MVGGYPSTGESLVGFLSPEIAGVGDAGKALRRGSESRARTAVSELVGRVMALRASEGKSGPIRVP